MEMSGLAKNPSGNIRVGIGGYQLTGLLAAAFLRYHKTFPNIRIDIVNETTPRILEQLKNNLLDVGVGTLLANVADLPTEILFEEELVVIVQKKSAFRKRLLITPAEVGQLGLVLYDKSTGTREYLDEFFRREKITPRIVVELSSAEAMLQLVKAGFGATIIPKSAAHETYECLRALRIKGKPLARQTCVVTTSFPRMPQVINTLVQLIRNCFMKEPTAMESGFSRQSRQAYGLPGETAATRFPT
jgi:DNA-binding transcriptional LysR family regulator